ncbi:dirigent protein 21 [Brachypodium distachyon]|uniref:Dirigent protein n=1 Tax=Brachypodium distachyon TaxID=15368 RepID=I1ITY8_BRADI|nr:dirigent protein 21 [Brachypodium distachyon]KQJ92028.1 hypothetical protein BRADI_4g41300v3 [Brachypodium distachyon]|eukprot:XP_010238661.1 dirigent protein 21 [Brachypodium distachyon]
MAAIVLFVFVLLATAAHATQSSAPPPSTTHIKLYAHEVVSGRHPTAVTVARAPTTKASKTFFGEVFVMDDILTTAADDTGKPVGRAQGTYCSASRDSFTLLMDVTFVFTAGEFNGSSLGIVGRNDVRADVRELPVVGGTGVFRWARGYAQLSTSKFDLKSGDSTIEYNIFVRH